MVRIVRTEGLPREAQTNEEYGWATLDAEEEMPSNRLTTTARMLERVLERKQDRKQGRK